MRSSSSFIAVAIVSLPTSSFVTGLQAPIHRSTQPQNRSGKSNPTISIPQSTVSGLDFDAAAGGGSKISPRAGFNLPPFLQRDNGSSADIRNDDALLSAFSPSSETDALAAHVVERHSLDINIKPEPSPAALQETQLDDDDTHEMTVVKEDGLSAPSIQTWKRRLVTREDKLSMHKLSCSGYVLSSLVILGTGAITSMQNTPDFLEPFVMLFMVSSFVQGISSIEMAKSHRKQDDGGRNGFISSAFNLMNLGFLTVLTTPFAGDILSSPEAAEVWLAVMTMLLLREGKELVNINAMLDSRTKTKMPGSPDDATNSLLQTASYVAAPVVQILGNLSLYVMLVALTVTHTAPRETFVQLMHDNPAQMSIQFYNTVLQSNCIGWGALMVTLRDKKLVSKAVEANTIGALNFVGALSLLQMILSPILSG